MNSQQHHVTIMVWSTAETSSAVADAISETLQAAGWTLAQRHALPEFPARTILIFELRTTQGGRDL